MNIQFATCEKHRALEYIQQVYPDKEITEKEVSKLLSLVERDIVRIQDPLMYGSRIQVIQGNKYKDENKPEIDGAITQLKDNSILKS